MDVSPIPRGVVLLFLNEREQVIATETDFEPCAPSDRQYRSYRILALSVVKAYAAPDLARAFNADQAVDLMRRLVRNHGCSIRVIEVGGS